MEVVLGHMGRIFIKLCHRLSGVIAWTFFVCMGLHAHSLTLSRALDIPWKSHCPPWQSIVSADLCVWKPVQPESGLVACLIPHRSFSFGSLLLEPPEILRRLETRWDDSVLAGRFMDSGESCYGRGDFKNAERLLTEAVERYRRLTDGAVRIDLARSLAGLGRCSSELGKYAEADSALEEALSMYRRLYRKVSRVEFACVLRAAARASFDRGDYKKARIRYADVLGMRRRLFSGQDAPELAESLLEMGLFNYRQGVYAKAGGGLEEALTIYRACYPGNDDPDLLRCRIAIASYYQRRGKSEKAARQLDTALPMLDRLRNYEPIQRLTGSMIDISLLLLAREDTAGARARLLEVVDTFHRRYGVDFHFDLARAVSLLGMLAVQGDDLAEAKSWLDKAAHIYTRLCDERDHPDRANLECMRAAYFARSHQWNRADSAFESASAMYHRLYRRTGQLDLALGIERVARLAKQYEMNNRAEIACHDLLEILPRVTRESGAFEGEDEQIRFRQHLGGIADSLAHFFLDHGETTELFELSLWSKGRVLAAVEWRNRVLAELRQSDPQIDTALNRYRTLRRVIYRTAFDTCSASGVSAGDFDRWQEQQQETSAVAERIEDSLVAHSAAVKTGRHEITWKGVARQLHRGQYAVEFMRIADGSTADSATYYALVLRQGRKPPTQVKLCSERDLIQVLRFPVAHDEVSSYIHDLNHATQLYQFVWAPLEPLLRGCHRVYLSPDGLLNRVAFGALRTDLSVALHEKYDLRYAFSLRDLVPGPTVPGPVAPREPTAVVMGGVRYACDSAALYQANAHTLSEPSLIAHPLFPSHSNLPRDGGIRLPLAPLEGSRREVDSVVPLLALHSYRVVRYEDSEATEEVFMRLHSPTVLHIATHGFFFRDPQLPRERLNRMRFQGGIDMVQYAENPLVRTGILLAGADRVWSGKRPLKGLDDGIVTAYDVAGVDLSGTELVVLSACETGLGDIRVGEGVFGLKRSFRAAGARAVMMSLWKVPDKQTCELMQLFYKYWLEERMEKGAALNMAQREMAGKHDDPYYWAAFVLVGE